MSTPVVATASYVQRLLQWVALLALSLACLVLSTTKANAEERVLLGAPSGVGRAALSSLTLRAALQDLAVTAQERGSVRVIVGVRAAFAPEGKLSATTAALQRTEIASAQSVVLARFPAAAQKERPVRRFASIPYVALSVTPAELEALEQMPEVTSIEEDKVAAPSLAYSVPHIGSTTAWSSGYTGAGQAVAVLDTGVEKTHPLLAGKVIAEACYSSNYYGVTSFCPGGVEESTAPGSGEPCTGANGCSHGTHVAGIAAGRNGSSNAPAGVAKDANIIAIQVFSKFSSAVFNCGAAYCARTYSSDQIMALERVYELRNAYQIAAVNMSLVHQGYSDQASCDSSNYSQKAAIDNLRAVGIATVISSGNDGYTNALTGPSCISSAISVGSTHVSDAISSFSNSAPFLNLLAPGSNIVSSVVGQGYQSYSGTSMAAPHVAGAWAILKQRKPTASVNEVLNVLVSTGQPVTDSRNGITKSRIQVAQALATIGGGNYALSVSRQGTGSGTVTSSPAGISCGSTCTASYTSGTQVTLYAHANTGSSFAGWSGACSGTNSSCTVTMSAARSVTAIFNVTATNRIVTLSKSGTGTGSVSSTPSGLSCAGDCPSASTSFVSTAIITLTAQAASGSTFVGWSGACSGTYSDCTIPASSSTANVTAQFNAIAVQNYTLWVGRQGTGSGTVTSIPSGIECGSVCAASFTAGTQVTLIAQAASGSAFTGWSGACSGTSTCTVSMDMARSVTANFNTVVLNHNLTVWRQGTGSGTVTSTPGGIYCGSNCSASYAAGTSVTLSAQAATDSTFTGWSGACSGTGTCTVPVDDAKSVTASFTLKGVATGQSQRLAAGGFHTAFIRDNGNLWAWGFNNYGQLGDGSTTDRTSPVWVGADYTAVAAGTYHTLALKADGSLWAWGSNEYGQLGDGSLTQRTSPVQIGTGYIAIAADESHSLALKADGNLWAWGRNDQGQLGDGSTTDRSSPVWVGTGYTAVAAGYHHSLALKAYGSLWTWGNNGYGQLGDGSFTQRTSPVWVGTGYTTVAVGSLHTLALKTDGSLWAWGYNERGQLGDGSTTDRASPVQIGAGYTAVAAGSQHSLALKADGSLWVWGYNGYTQLGDGSTDHRFSPIRVGANYTAVSGGAYHSLALKADGSLWAWGYNSSGQLGDGSRTIRTTPVLVNFGSTASVSLNVLKAGTGTGTVTSSPAGINCGSTCMASYSAGTQVTLYAQAASGSSFAGWSGACSGTGSCTVSMDSARSVTASFSTGSGGGPLPDPVVFVTQQYRDFLHRNPGSVDLNNWVNQFNAGTLTRAQLIETLMESGESQGRFGPIIRLYTAYFLRLPDYGGLMYWFNTMYPGSGAGSSLAQVSDQFAGSAEFVARYGALSNSGFVALVYQNVLGRTAEPGGFTYWVGQLNAGMTRGQMMIGFSESAENQALTANAQRITLVYASMLQRMPSTTEHAQWLADIQAGRANMLSLINSLLQSAEYAARF